MAYYLGVDQGSNSSRAVLFDDNGDVVAHAAYKVKLTRNDADHAVHDPRQLLDSVTDVISRVLASLDTGQLEQVSACGIATQRSTSLAWHADGSAISPALSWQDVRARDMLESLKPHEQEIMRLTGLPLTPYYSATKMNWLLNCSESVKHYDRDEIRLSPLISYLLYHLLDNRPYTVDFSNAQRTQLFRLDTLAWSQQLCDWFGVDSGFLPECRPMCTGYGRLLDTRIPVKSVCGDQNAAIFGFGALGSDIALVNIGSGAFVLRELDRFSNSSSQLTGIAHADEERVSYMREATINGAGNALAWALQQWQIDEIADDLPAWLQQVTAPPVFLNTVGGLGTPWMQGGLPSVFVDGGDYSVAEKVVAIIESIVFMIQVNLELMAAEAPLNSLRVSGGLSNLDGLCQKLSNLSGLEVERSHLTEATARGVAWLAAGRPASWRIGGADGDRGFMHFKPYQDDALLARYRQFKSGISQLLDDGQSAGAAQ